jgi:hypothetical protein
MNAIAASIVAITVPAPAYRIAVVLGPLRSFDNSIFAEHTSMK